MSDAWFIPGLLVALFGVFAAAVGLVQLLAASTLTASQRSTAALVGGLALAGLAAAMAWLDQPADLWLFPLLLTVPVGLSPVLCSRRLAGICTRAWAWLGDPQGQGALLLLAVPVLAWAMGQRAAEHFLHPADVMISFSVPQLREIGSSPATTDWGRRVRLHEVTQRAWPTPAMRTAEQYLLARPGVAHRTVRTAPINPHYNCHGWIFTGGRYFLADEFVEGILQDNGYWIVPEPQPQDLAIYRNPKGAIVHSGMVRLAEKEGLILVESKWGWLGRYLHPPEATFYADSSCTYYRSLRTSHLLAGLEPENPSAGTPAPTVESRRTNVAQPIVQTSPAQR